MKGKIIKIILVVALVLVLAVVLTYGIGYLFYLVFLKCGLDPLWSFWATVALFALGYAVKLLFWCSSGSKRKKREPKVSESNQSSNSELKHL